ncbi:adenine DNA glycosylase-like isoform X1 [Punica granatum]|uniref:Adenine DNA glycosylase n=1 Tax=Punica granatum TaxID=22663 RepID=A0A6P8E6A4_PUNGR|nr:adenine DNA glycosylase-like isoform X1 [Punica granatum]
MNGPLLLSPLRISFLPLISSMKPQKKQPTKNNPQTGKRKRGGAAAAGNGRTAPQVKDIEDLLPFTGGEVSSIRGSLLEWYDVNCRDLPWRRKECDSDGGGEDDDHDEEERRAYGVWVSEVMLQQTRVQTVIEYYNRWMLKWPSVHHLASASLEEVNEMWAGLGYYRRARFLLEGAKMIVAGEEGFPRTVAQLRKVPGIGEYTAGAIASIAFKEVVPAVDGNVIRVLARLKAISTNPKDSTTIKNFWKLAGQLVDNSRPGDFNQSLMELGATVCTPLNPTCSLCSISSQCRAYAICEKDTSVAVTDYPVKVVKTKQRHNFSAVCVVEILRGTQESEFLLVKRPNEGLLAGLWEFPSVEVDQEADSSVRRREVDGFLKQSFGLDLRKCNIILREDVGEFVHIFTHIRLKICAELLVVHLDDEMRLLRKHSKENAKWKLVDCKAVSSMGLTSSVRKVYSMVQKFKQSNLSQQKQKK